MDLIGTMHQVRMLCQNDGTLAVVLGSTGYVGGEILRLLGTHPDFRLAAAVSASRSGDAIADVEFAFAVVAVEVHRAAARGPLRPRERRHGGDGAQKARPAGGRSEPARPPAHLR